MEPEVKFPDELWIEPGSTENAESVVNNLVDKPWANTYS